MLATLTLALALATQPARLASLRQRLEAAHATAPLFDVAGFARQLEAAYRAVWRQHMEGGGANRICVEQPS